MYEHVNCLQHNIKNNSSLYFCNALIISELKIVGLLL
jgi:hypothetical protein